MDFLGKLNRRILEIFSQDRTSNFLKIFFADLIVNYLGLYTGFNPRIEEIFFIINSIFDGRFLGIFEKYFFQDSIDGFLLNTGSHIACRFFWIIFKE